MFSLEKQSTFTSTRWDVASLASDDPEKGTCDCRSVIGAIAIQRCKPV
jgi:hypothetical protein